MKKPAFLVLILLALFLIMLSACSSEDPATDESADEPVSEPASDNAEHTEPAGEETPDATVTSDTVTDQPDSPESAWQDIYIGFLSENYDSIVSLSLNSIAGVGFIDLDIDGVPELVLFDAGASASMGVQLFDIAQDGSTVYCVSANLSGILGAYGSAESSGIIINTNYFDDFRLYQDGSGAKLFIVESGNGTEDSSYREIIRFTNQDGKLGLESLFYKYTETVFDEASQSTVIDYETYRRNAVDVSSAEYNESYNAFFASITDTGYDAAGCFIWESKEYDSSRASFLELVDLAITYYTPIP